MDAPDALASSVRLRCLDLSLLEVGSSFIGSPIIVFIVLHEIGRLAADLTDLLSMRMLPALRLVFSLPVLVSAGAAKSGISTDPEVDIFKREGSQPYPVSPVDPNAQCMNEQDTADNLSMGMIPI